MTNFTNARIIILKTSLHAYVMQLIPFKIIHLLNWWKRIHKNKNGMQDFTIPYSYLFCICKRVYYIWNISA